VFGLATVTRALNDLGMIRKQFRSASMRCHVDQGEWRNLNLALSDVGYR